MWVFFGSVVIACSALVGIYLSYRADRARDRVQAESDASAARDLSERNHEATIRQARQEAVAPKYAEVLQVIWDITNPPKSGPVKPEAIAERFFTITRTLAIWGSDQSVCAWRDWRSASRSLAAESEGSLRILDEFDTLLRSMRADMGHANDGIAGASDSRFGDLIGLFLTEDERPSS
jgi:hypothetical protein